jgi:hypothetical protein
MTRSVIGSPAVFAGRALPKFSPVLLAKRKDSPCKKLLTLHRRFVTRRFMANIKIYLTNQPDLLAIPWNKPQHVRKMDIFLLSFTHLVTISSLDKNGSSPTFLDHPGRVVSSVFSVSVSKQMERLPLPIASLPPNFHKLFPTNFLIVNFTLSITNSGTSQDAGSS